jgi:thioredoxin 1
MEEDKELERIKSKKLREMFKRRALKEEAEVSRGQRGSALNKPVELTDAIFKETVQSNSLVVVDCWAPWCAPCHIVSPVVEEMARDYAGKIMFGKLNVDENRRVAMQYQIMSIIGAMPRRMLEPRITRHL